MTTTDPQAAFGAVVVESRTDRPNMLITVLCAMLSALVVIGFGRLAYGVILPSMRADLGLSYQQAGMLSTVTALSYVCFVLAGGLAAARWGAKASILFGMITVLVGFTGLVWASNFWLAVLWMGLLGFGSAFVFAPMVSLLASWFPERRGLAIGGMSSGVGISTLITGMMVPYLLARLGDQGWRISWVGTAGPSSGVWHDDRARAGRGGHGIDREPFRRRWRAFGPHSLFADVYVPPDARNGAGASLSPTPSPTPSPSPVLPPRYITALEARGRFRLLGSHAILRARSSGFRVYLLREGANFTRAEAVQYGLRVHWLHVADAVRWFAASVRSAPCRVPGARYF